MRRGLVGMLALVVAGCAHVSPTAVGDGRESRDSRDVPDSRDSRHDLRLPHPDALPLGEGIASFYGPGLEGRLTANGERFDSRKLTAAHRTLPFGTCVRVRNLGNGREVDIRVNDRGPYAGHRIIDVSRAAAVKLGMIETGLARVRLFHCGEFR